MKIEESRESWLNRLSTLNVGRQKYGLAPYKPLLMVAAHIQQHAATGNDDPQLDRSLCYQHNRPLRFDTHARLRPNPGFLQWHWERFHRAGR